MQWPESADEIVVRDGHLTIRLRKIADGWRATVESSIEGRVFEGRVAEMSELLVGDYAARGNEQNEQNKGEQRV